MFLLETHDFSMIDVRILIIASFEARFSNNWYRSINNINLETKNKL